MNKLQLIEAVAERTGDRTSASTAVEAVLDSIVRTVVNGEAVNVTGFGTFEGRYRPGRIARNPQDGARVHVPASRRVRFRPGANFKDLIAGRKSLPAATSAIQKAPKTPRY